MIRLDELGQEKIVRLIIRLWINAGKQTDHPSRRTICVVRLFRRICSRVVRLDGWSVCLPAFIHRRVTRRTIFLRSSSGWFVLSLYLDGWSVRRMIGLDGSSVSSINRAIKTYEHQNKVVRRPWRCRYLMLATWLKKYGVVPHGGGPHY